MLFDLFPWQPSISFLSFVCLVFQLCAVGKFFSNPFYLSFCMLLIFCYTFFFLEIGENFLYDFVKIFLCIFSHSFVFIYLFFCKFGLFIVSHNSCMFCAWIFLDLTFDWTVNFLPCFQDLNFFLPCLLICWWGLPLMFFIFILDFLWWFYFFVKF